MLHLLGAPSYNKYDGIVILLNNIKQLIRKNFLLNSFRLIIDLFVINNNTAYIVCVIIYIFEFYINIFYLKLRKIFVQLKKLLIQNYSRKEIFFLSNNLILFREITITSHL